MKKVRRQLFSRENTLFHHLFGSQATSMDAIEQSVAKSDSLGSNYPTVTVPSYEYPGYRNTLFYHLTNHLPAEPTKYPVKQPEPPANHPLSSLFGSFQSESVLPITETINVKAIHSLTKEVIATLHTIDKSLDLLIKSLSILDNYKVNLAGPGSSGFNGASVLKLATDFVKKVDVNQLERAIDILQSPLLVEMLTSGFNFDEDSGEND